MKYSYRFKFFINATHSVNFGEIKSNIHPHTWEIALFINISKGESLNFSNFEKDIEKYISKFEGKYLNEMEEFNDKTPTMENIGVVVNENIKSILTDKELILDRLEISENPTRTYIIENN